MIDRKKVIKGLECCQYSSKSHCDGCPYGFEGLCATNNCTADLASDALALLKEQEERCEQCAYKLYSAKEIEKNSNLNELWKPKD